MICNNIEDIENCEHTAKIVDKLENILLILGDHDIEEVYKNRVSYSKETLELLTTQFYVMYELLCELNKDVVYRNKIYRNRVKTTHRYADDQ